MEGSELKVQVHPTPKPKEKYCPKTDPVTTAEDLKSEGISCASNLGGRKVDHIVVNHGELQEVLGQCVMLCSNLQNKPVVKMLGEHAT